MEHFLLSCVESRVENSRSFYGRFQLGPFEIGQGLTVANALRRTLLSEITGFAITLVEVEGASHEYSTLDGVRESVLDILLNLKQLGLKSDFQIQQPLIGYVNIQGPAVVRAGDLKLPLPIQCVDSEQYIATLSNNGSLKLKFMISQGTNLSGAQAKVAKGPSITDRSQTWFDGVGKQFEKYFNNPNRVAEPGLVYRISRNLKDDVLGSLKYKTFNQFVFSKEWNLRKRKRKNSYAIEDGDPGPKVVLSWEHGVHLNLSEALKVALYSAKGQAKGPRQYPVSPTGYKPERSSGYRSKIWQQFRRNCSQLRRTDGRPSGSPQSETSFRPMLLNDEEMRIRKKTLAQTIDFVKKETRQRFANTAERSESNSGPKNLRLQNTMISAAFAIDAIFAPINKVNYLIETDEDFDFLKEKVILEIWTNGSIHPRTALHKAAQTLIQFFYPFQETKFMQTFSTHYFQTSNQSLILASRTGEALTSEGLKDEARKDLFVRSIPRKGNKLMAMPSKMDFYNPHRFDDSGTLVRRVQAPTTKVKPIFISKKRALAGNESSIRNRPLAGNESSIRNRSSSYKSQTFGKKLGSLDIGNLDFSLQVYTTLKKNNINTINDLISYSRTELVKRMSENLINEIEKNLFQIGLALRL